MKIRNIITVSVAILLFITAILHKEQLDLN